MLLCVVALFGLCWLPLHIFFVVVEFCQTPSAEQERRLVLAHLVVVWLAMANSCVNPIIYGFLNESFQVSSPPHMCLNLYSGSSADRCARLVPERREEIVFSSTASARHLAGAGNGEDRRRRERALPQSSCCWQSEASGLSS